MSAPISRLDLAPSTANLDHISEYHFGEEPTSFRSVLKRFTTAAIGFGSPGGNSNVYNPPSLNCPIFPTSTLKYNASASARTLDEMFSYLRYAYLGYRGSIRWRSRFFVGLTNNNAVAYHYMAWLSSPTNTQLAAATYSIPAAPNIISRLNGSTLIAHAAGGGPEFEFPFYTNNLFLYPMSESTDDGATNGETELYFPRDWNVAVDQIGGNTGVKWALDVASGEDFGFLRFQGAPYYNGGIVF